jgi:hypothetical protein
LYPDPTTPGYNQCFVKALNRDAFASSSASPERLFVPSLGQFNIFVDPVCAFSFFNLFFAIHQQLSQVAGTLQQTGRCQWHKRRKATEVHSAEFLSAKKNAADASFQQIVNWLKGQAADNPRFHRFKAEKKKILTNPEIVNLWKFVAAFAGEHIDRVLSPVCLIDC